MNEINDDTRDIAAAVQAGRDAATADLRVTDVDVLGQTIPVCVNHNGDVFAMEGVIAQAERLAPAPARRKLALTFTEVASFVAYVNRFKHATRTAIYADVQRKQLTAVIDDFDEGGLKGNGGAAWREHRAAYSCPLAPEWLLFKQHANKAMSQGAFGDFIEANMEYLTSGDGFPAPGDVLLMARSLVINTKGTFTRKIDRTSGNGTLICTTDHGDESTKIPRAFLLALRVFEGGDARMVEARLQFTMEGNSPAFTFVLHRVTEHEAEAFAEVRGIVEASTGCPLFAGTPG